MKNKLNKPKKQRQNKRMTAYQENKEGKMHGNGWLWHVPKGVRRPELRASHAEESADGHLTLTCVRNYRGCEVTTNPCKPAGQQMTRVGFFCWLRFPRVDSAQ